MVQEKDGVQLSTQEKGASTADDQGRQEFSPGRSPGRAILLKTDEGWTAAQVAVALDISERTVFRAERRYAEEGTGRGAAAPQPDQPVPEAGRPW